MGGTLYEWEERLRGPTGPCAGRNCPPHTPRALRKFCPCMPEESLAPVATHGLHRARRRLLAARARWRLSSCLMRLSRLAKRCLPTLAAVVMLLCQTISLAHACASGVSQAGDAGAAPCHDSGGEADSGKTSSAGHSCQYVCAAADSRPVVMAASDLPIITIRFDSVTP